MFAMFFFIHESGKYNSKMVKQTVKKGYSYGFNGLKLVLVKLYLNFSRSLFKKTSESIVKE